MEGETDQDKRARRYSTKHSAQPTAPPARVEQLFPSKEMQHNLAHTKRMEISRHNFKPCNNADITTIARLSQFEPLNAPKPC